VAKFLRWIYCVHTEPRKTATVEKCAIETWVYFSCKIVGVENHLKCTTWKKCDNHLVLRMGSIIPIVQKHYIPEHVLQVLVVHRVWKNVSTVSLRRWYKYQTGDGHEWPKHSSVCYYEVLINNNKRWWWWEPQFPPITRVSFSATERYLMWWQQERVLAIFFFFFFFCVVSRGTRREGSQHKKSSSSRQNNFLLGEVNCIQDDFLQIENFKNNELFHKVNWNDAIVIPSNKEIPLFLGWKFCYYYFNSNLP
jgi:hypothetical protein